nr:MAG TPA: hypothetical protein [Caudoviricetes sp.]
MVKIESRNRLLFYTLTLILFYDILSVKVRT